MYKEGIQMQRTLTYVYAQSSFTDGQHYMAQRHNSHSTYAPNASKHMQLIAYACVYVYVCIAVHELRA